MTGTYVSNFKTNKQTNKKALLESTSQSLSKCDSWASIISILCALTRNAEFGASPISTESAPLGWGLASCVLIKALQVILMLNFEDHCCKL